MYSFLDLSEKKGRTFASSVAALILICLTSVNAQSENRSEANPSPLYETPRDRIMPYVMLKAIPPFMLLEVSEGLRSTRERIAEPGLFLLHQPDGFKSFAVLSCLQAAMLFASPQLRATNSMERIRRTLFTLGILGTGVSELSQSLNRGLPFDTGDFVAGILGASAFYMYDRLLCSKLLTKVASSNPPQTP